MGKWGNYYGGGWGNRGIGIIGIIGGIEHSDYSDSSSGSSLHLLPVHVTI